MSNKLSGRNSYHDKKTRNRRVVLRIFLGAAFFAHGLAKFQGGIGNTAAFFESLGLPGFAAYIVATIELIGGAAMILGIGTRVIACLFVLIMAGAIFKVKLAAGFLGSNQSPGYEIDLALMIISVYFIIGNRSSLALDNLIFRSKQQ